MNINWVYEQTNVDWAELAELYKIAPLADKDPPELELVFSNSMFKCFLYDGGKLVGVGRAVADGKDVSYIGDVAVHPDCQGKGLGKQIMNQLMELSAGHSKILLYASPGKEGFYAKLGFKMMTTAMAIFSYQERAFKMGMIKEYEPQHGGNDR